MREPNLVTPRIPGLYPWGACQSILSQGILCFIVPKKRKTMNTLRPTFNSVDENFLGYIEGKEGYSSIH